MNWLTSPLAATVVVFAVLASLAIPLRRLTSDRATLLVPTGQVVAGNAAAGNDVGGVMIVRLLMPAEEWVVLSVGGEELWRADGLGAGEHEISARFPWDDGAVELIVEAVFADAVGDTAVFLSVLPDGMPGITQYAIGAGRIDELMVFEWNPN